MPKLVIKNGTVLVGALDLSANVNQATVDASADELDVTNLASAGNYECMGGLAKVDLQAQGFFEGAGAAYNPQAELVKQLGAINPATLTITNPCAAGDFAYLVSSLETHYDFGGQIGQLARLNLQLNGSGQCFPGKVLETVVRTTTGVSAGLNLGAAIAGQRVAITVHDIAQSGTTPTLDLIIQSDTTNGFGAPTTRFTVPQFNTATGISSYYATLAGPITDTWWRVSATVAGTTPSFTYRVAIAIA
jgi:hypothetical protein